VIAGNYFQQKAMPLRHGFLRFELIICSRFVRPKYRWPGGPSRDCKNFGVCYDFAEDP